jgi:hypothetical protein
VLTGGAEEGGTQDSGEVRQAGRSRAGCAATSASSYGRRRDEAPGRGVVLLLALLLLFLPFSFFGAATAEVEGQRGG